jgi:hypothetical protein
VGMMKRKAYLYQRFSSDQQIGNSSIFRQSFKQHEWLKAHPDFECDGEYVDESKSASKGDHLKRGELGDLVQEIEQGKINKGSYILVEGFSRLSRLDTPETEELLRKIWKAGITIVTVQNGQEYPPDTESNFGLRIQLLVEVNGAYLESKIRSERIKGSYDRREFLADSGEYVKIKKPFWLDINGKLNDSAEIIQKVFDWYVNHGLGQQRIYQKLKEEYPDFEPFKKLSPSTVIRWIKSKSVIGYWVRFAGTEVERSYKVYESAISDKLFGTAEKINEEKLYDHVKPDSNMALHGLLQCGHCGGGITVQKSYHKNGMPLLRCSRQARYGKQHCGYKSTFPYAVAYYLYQNSVHRDLLNLLSEKVLNPKEEQELIDIDSKLLSIKKKISKFKAKALDLEQEDEDDEIADILSKLKQMRKPLTLRKLQIEKNFKEGVPYLDTEVKALENEPKKLNLSFIQLQKKMTISNRTISYVSRKGVLSSILYKKYSQKEKAYEIERNFLIISKDLSNPEILSKYADVFEDDTTLEGEEVDNAFYDYQEKNSKKPHQKVRVTEFLKTTDICKQVK